MRNHRVAALVEDSDLIPALREQHRVGEDRAHRGEVDHSGVARDCDPDVTLGSGWCFFLWDRLRGGVVIKPRWFDGLQAKLEAPLIRDLAVERVEVGLVDKAVVGHRRDADLIPVLGL